MIQPVRYPNDFEKQIQTNASDLWMNIWYFQPHFSGLGAQRFTSSNEANKDFIMLAGSSFISISTHSLIKKKRKREKHLLREQASNNYKLQCETGDKLVKLTTWQRRPGTATMSMSCLQVQYFDLQVSFNMCRLYTIIIIILFIL